MNAIKAIYKRFCRFEEVASVILLAGLTSLVFISALMRTLGMPLNWAQDVALVAFAWLIFLGSDIAVRGPGLIGVNIIVKNLPSMLQKTLDILFKVIIIGLLGILVVFGFQMTVQGWDREITTLGISYSWVTMAVPVGSFFMIISTGIRLVETIKKPVNKFVLGE